MLNRLLILYIVIFQIFHIYSEESYILKEGDTLYSLGKKKNISIEEIIRYNQIEDFTALPVGTAIKFPSKYKVKSYIVRQGDTLFSISKKFDLPLSIIMEYNNLKAGDIISLGQVLLLEKVVDNINETEEIELDPTNELDRVDTSSVITEKLDESVSDDSIPYWPVNGDISKYSGRIQGVRIEGSSGEYIKAVSDGRVIWYDSFKGIGKVVLIEGDNGYDYLYGTQEDLNVHMGVQITAGERLGRLKDSNTSIIFSVFKNGKPLSDISEAPR